MEISTDFGPIFHYQYRIILIGDSTVGKSSILRYFTEGRSAETSDPTVGVDFYARVIELNTQLRIKLQLWDTAGQEKFKSITRSYYRNSVGVIIVYDITNRKSFEHAAEWLSEAELNVGGPSPSNTVFMLVGHKADLEKQREILFEEGEYFAKYHKLKFIETSAMKGENVNVGWFGCFLYTRLELQELFYMVAREINAKLQSGQLMLQDGWDGIKSGSVRTQSIALSDYDLEKQDGDACSC